MSCTEVQSTKYQTRKLPPFHAQDCKGLTKPGKDGEYVSWPDIKGVYTWVKAGARKTDTRNTRKGKGKGKRKGKGKTYDIHDNGNMPFRVFVSGKTVEIYKGNQVLGNNYNENRNYNQLIRKLSVKNVYPGESLCGVNRVSDFHCGTDTIGNSVLLQMEDGKCVFVGKEIYEFTMEDDVEAYYSMIGLNDIHYPVLLGTKYVYFMLDRIYVSRDLFKAPMNALEWADAYTYYYGFKNLKTGETSTTKHTIPKKDTMKMKNVKMIQK